MLTITNPNKRNKLPAARMTWVDGERKAVFLLDKNNGPAWLKANAPTAAASYALWMAKGNAHPMAKLMAAGKARAEVLRRAAGLGAPAWHGR